MLDISELQNDHGKALCRPHLGTKQNPSSFLSFGSTKSIHYLTLAIETLNELVGKKIK